MSPPSDPFRFRHPISVRFRDVDAMGHVHHATALVYFEEARWAYWATVVGRPSLDRIEFVMAEARVRWHARVLWPQDLSVAVRVARVGAKHFEMAYEVEGTEGARLVTGSTVQVMYDASTGSAIAVPDELRALLEGFEAALDRP